MQNQEKSISDKERLKVVSSMLCLRFDDINNKLGLGLRNCGKYYAGKCPIHQGDNSTALNFYIDGFAQAGYWVCWTKGCQNKCKSTAIGFIRGVLSAQQKREVTFPETISWIEKFLGKKVCDIKIDEALVKSTNFAKSMDIINKKPVEQRGVTKYTVRQNLEIPPKFLLDKGFPKEILDKFDVGLCTNKSKEMFGRIVVPIYNNSGIEMVACTSRATHPRCIKCGLYHNPSLLNCPSSSKINQKWFHSNDKVNSWLYNYWNVKKILAKHKNEIILVEGPADVWRLEQFGIENVVAIFGTSITEEQEVILEISGCQKLVLLLDMDEAGRKGCEEIQKKYKNFYKIETPNMKKNDPADYLNKEEFLTDVNYIFR